MTWFLLAGCAAPDPEVARLSAEVAELKARIEALEARPALPPEVAALLGQGFTPPREEAVVRGPEALTWSLLDDPAQLATLARVIPHRDAAGEADGFRLSAIRAGSLLDRLGVKNGDIVHTVNGRAVTTVEAAVSLAAELEAARPAELRLSLTRRGEPLELTIPVGDPAR
jgi:S1-C subfamily serine protease